MLLRLLLQTKAFATAALLLVRVSAAFGGARILVGCHVDVGVSSDWRSVVDTWLLHTILLHVIACCIACVVKVVWWPLHLLNGMCRAS